MTIEDLIDVSVTYGLGGTATASLPRHLLEESSNRSVIEWTIREKQEPGSAAERTAILVGELLQSGHAIDVEKISEGSDAIARPVALDDVALLPSDARGSSDRERSERPGSLHYHLTEPYRGGFRP